MRGCVCLTPRIKPSTREEIFEKLGAFVDGRKGMIGVTSKRQLELLFLILFMMQQEKVPTKWLQILLGKFVHMVQFRRPLFSCISTLDPASVWVSWTSGLSFRSCCP